MKKFFRILLIVVAVFAALIIIPPAFIKADSNYEQSIEINASQEVVFNHVNNLKNWDEWSPWQQVDPEMTSVFEGPDEGVGAKRIWKSKSQGDGSMTISESKPHESLKYDIAFEGRGEGYGYWKFDKKDNATLVTWSFYMGDMGYFGKWFNLIFAGMMNDMLNNGLQNLKAVSEG